MHGKRVHPCPERGKAGSSLEAPLLSNVTKDTDWATISALFQSWDLVVPARGLYANAGQVFVPFRLIFWSQCKYLRTRVVRSSVPRGGVD